MALFKKLFGKSEGNKLPKGFHQLTVASVDKLTDDTVKVTLDIPNDLAGKFNFTPGQYINFAVTINGKEHRRSYSICSGQEEAISVAVKAVENGTVSTWFNKELNAGAPVIVSLPEGNFTLDNQAKHIVAVAAGSGITPILSMAKSMEKSGGKLELFYGSKSFDNIIFKSEIDGLANTKPTYYLSQEEKEGYAHGRIDKEAFTAAIKNNLDLLKTDGFFLCGPEQMIMDAADTLKFFGVSEDKIHFELFTDPVLMKPKSTGASSFEGSSKVTLIMDGEKEELTLGADDIILTAAIENGMDAPYSCKGGVCSTCKAKVIEGSAGMKLNYSLTDKDVEEGYILTCQAHPTSENLTVSFDE